VRSHRALENAIVIKILKREEEHSSNEEHCFSKTDQGRTDKGHRLTKLIRRLLEFKRERGGLEKLKAKQAEEIIRFLPKKISKLIA